MYLRSACLLLFILPSAALAQSGWTRPVAAGSHSCLNFYPHAAVWDGIEGSAIVEFTVTAEGTVQDARIQRTSGDDDLDQASLNCVSGWKYKPATHDGAPVEMRNRAQVQWMMNAPENAPGPCSHYANVTSALLKGIGGVTRVSFRIMADGTVTGAQVLSSSGDDTLDQAALRCLGERRFDTARAVISDQGVPKTVSVDWHADLGPAN